MRRISALGVVAPLSRAFWDPTGPMREGAMMDEKDLAQMFPTTKPKTVAGEYGYTRTLDFQTFAVANPYVRLPHDRRILNPKAARIVTVFGASGFLGAQVVREFAEHPDILKVRACTRYPTLIPVGSDLELLLQKYPEKIELHECDVTDRIQVNVAANGADTLVMAIDFHNEYAHNSHFDVYVTGAINISWSSKTCKCERVIYCSGLDSTFASESGYCDMRCRGEDACGANNIDSTILRFGPLYGKGYRYRGLGRYIYPAAFANTNVAPLWVIDAARTVVRASQSSRAVSHRFDLGGPETLKHVDFWRKVAEEIHPRIVFACPKGIARFACRFAPWLFPNPWFDDNWLLTYELDQVHRKLNMFERLATWDRIGYTPHTIKEAAAIIRGDKEIVPLHILDKEFAKLEKKDKDDLKAEEALALKRGIPRSRAEPGAGIEGGMESLASEIYPGGQFRIKPLADAKYPSTVKNPHPVQY